jgi:transposase
MVKSNMSRIRRHNVADGPCMGLWKIGAITLSREVFYRHFDNRREVASYVGLTPTPFRSGNMHVDQGISKQVIRASAHSPSNSPGCGSGTNRRAP